MTRLALVLALLPSLAWGAPPPAGSLDEQLLAPYGREIERAMPDEFPAYSHADS